MARQMMYPSRWLRRRSAYRSSMLLTIDEGDTLESVVESSSTMSLLDESNSTSGSTRGRSICACSCSHVRPELIVSTLLPTRHCGTC